MGRQPTHIDWAEFDALCAQQCTQKEISEWFNCSVDTIDRAIKKEKKCGFAEYFSRKRCRGFVSLRKKQFEVALTGNVGMLVWLGKNYLDQTDKLETSNKELAKMPTDDLVKLARNLSDTLDKENK